ncbi:hypothetical protein GE09DRAFT_1221082 [Coniochaeta sp. 2T2.1]|nr:hypothetical protein GE09DRAFT_1221082 [Coniochaeta sp. 2T2.1]
MLYHPDPQTPYSPPLQVDPLGYGRVALITGCSSGIGLATTQLFLAHQFRVFGVDVAEFDYASLIRPEDQGRFHFHRRDLLLEAHACEETVRICVATFGGRIDVLVNVAGVLGGWGSVDGLAEGEWERVLGVNLTVPVRMMSGVVGFMKRKKEGGGEETEGCIVNVASVAGVSGAVAGVAYTASKHGLIGATKNVAWRFRNEGIRCNAVLPGAVDSSIGKAIAAGSAAEESGFEQVRPVFALQARSGDEGGTPITAMEVAKTIAFLVSDQARTINGVCLPVDKAWGVL